MLRSRRGAISLRTAIIAAVLTLGGVAASPRRAERVTDRLPDRLADSTFWRIVTTFSEPSGTFPSENFVSNETEWQTVIPGVLGKVNPASAYVGVGPEQNFTYIAAFQPHIAFICDIRRQNMIEHLMYKALIELSPDRADFLSRLWSRRRPDGLDSATTPADLLAAYRAVKADSLTFTLNLDAIFDRLVRAHKFTLNSEDSATMRAVYSVFFAQGPDISYSSSSRRGGGMLPQFFGQPGGVTFGGGTGSVQIMRAGTTGTIYISNGGVGTTYHMTTDSTGKLVVTRDSAGVQVPDSTFKPGNSFPFAGGLPGAAGISFPIGGLGFATFGSLMTEDDGAGVNRGWLGGKTAYRWLRDFETRNLLVPIVGNFAGSKALRSVAQYLKDNGAHVSAFYTSNVEQYLFQSSIEGYFYDNVAEMPSDANSIFIRSFPNIAFGYVNPRPSRSVGPRLAQTTSSIDTVLRAYRGGMLSSYPGLAQLQDR